MTMYHMAMPPHFGGTHPPAMHSSLFPGPLLPPMNHSHALHSFPPAHPNPNVTTGGTSDAPTSTMLHATPMISQPSSLYHPHQASSICMNSFLSNPQQGNAQALMTPHHGHSLIHPHNAPHSLVHNLGYANAGMHLLPASQPNRHTVQEHPQCFSTNRRLPLSVDEELLEEMNTLHLGYLETEDSPHKMEQREKLEHVILEYLAITPHSHKFIFQQVLEVLERSISRPSGSQFSAHEAACGFDALAQYAANLISQPWRKEFREIKLHNGFWVHQVASQLSGAETILELMGYVCVKSKNRSVSSPANAYTPGGQNCPDHYVLQGVLDPDLISRLALDCMIAYCECQCLKKIKEGVSEFGLSWAQILQYRQLYVGGVDVTLRNLLFTLRQRSNPLPYSSGTPGANLPSSPPPVPVRHSSSFAAASNTSYPQTSKPTTPTAPQSSMFTTKVEVSNSMEDFQNGTSSIHDFSSNHKNGRSHSLTGSSLTSPLSSGAVKKGQSVTSRPIELNGAAAHTSCPENGKGVNSSRVPTAKLIDLDSSLENIHHNNKHISHHLLPKVIPHKQNPKPFLNQSNNHCSLPNETTESPPSPLQPPPEAFQASTLEEQIEATLNLVKNPNRNSELGAKNSKDPPFETWDFVFRGLEKKGYNKDIGDRGDILHDMVRQKNYADVNNSGRNLNLNLNNQKKETLKNRPLTINQALQQFTLNETKERIDRPPSSKSSHSISHAYVHENHKRNSLYDNLSGGFETAVQDSDECDDRRPFPLRKVNNNMRTENIYRSDSKSETNRNCETGAASQRSCSSSIKVVVADSSIPVTSDLPSSKVTKPIENIEESRSKEGKSWSCVTCTFINKSEKPICEMCGKSKDIGPADIKPLVSGGKQCPLCTLINDKDTELCSACGVDLKGSSTYI